MFGRNEDILNAILNDDDISSLPIPQSREEALLLGVLAKIRNGGGSGGGSSATDLIHICVSGEYNQITGIPTVSIPNRNTLYLVPTSSSAQGNLFDEWVYVNNNWEQIGSVSFQIPQSDWAQTDSTAADYIKNKPSSASEVGF